MQDNTTANALTDETARQMTAYLEELMDRQIQKLRQYDLEAAMKIAEESQQLSEQITQNAVLSRPGFEQQRDRIQKLYRELCLTIVSGTVPDHRFPAAGSTGQTRTDSHRIKNIREVFREINFI
ncbi:MAG: hypothetical protein ACYTFX_01455 [Planctomycetota bacterium]|jgi:hypothetical protein